MAGVRRKAGRETIGPARPVPSQDASISVSPDPSANILRLLPLLLITTLLVILLLAFILQSLGPKEIKVDVSPDRSSIKCLEGSTKACSEGSCVGSSTCIGGIWRGCSYERICSPGTKVPCIKNSCVYAYKTCDECGTAFGPCEASG